jgi:hypothetical protein
MKSSLRFRLVGLLVAGAALAAAYHHAKTEEIMASSAEHLIQSLSAEQKPKVAFAFDADFREKWHFVPDNSYEQQYKLPRQGLTYKLLEPHQRRLADALLASGLSRGGMVKATSIMSLEDVLRIAEKDTTGRRDPEGYHVSIFGTPSKTGTWGYRIEGHHVSLNYTIKNGALVSTTPTFFGANPHEVREGPRSGIRVLGAEEDVARELVNSLTPEQRKTAVVSEEAPRDILTAASIRAKLEDQPAGLALSKLNKKQADLLMSVLQEYASNMPPEIAAARMKTAASAAKDKVFFAWAGSIEQGKGDYYRIQGPTFLVEYDNTQNDNNHSHSVWRDFNGDFGRDVLAMHHRLYDHGLGLSIKADAD